MKLEKELNNFKISTDDYLLELKDKQTIVPIQISGNKVVEIISGNEDLSEADGIYTSNTKLNLGIKTADCATVCLGDGNKIGAVHVGWRGLVGDIYKNILPFFNQNNLEVYVGPHIHKFEIKKDECYDELHKKFEDSFFIYDGIKIFFDFDKALRSILPQNTIFNSRDSFSDITLPSNRRDKTMERTLTTIFFK